MSRRRLPEGTVRQRGNGYLYIKRDGLWSSKGRDVWKRHYGAIPMHHVITFLDGNPENCSPENLQCVSRAQMAAVNRNFKRGDDPEITKAQFLWCDFSRALEEVRR